MKMVKIDEKGRVQLTKEMRHKLRLRPMETLEASIRDTTITLRPLKRRKFSKRDGLDWIIRNPAHVSRERLKRISLERIEEEMWLP